MHALDWMLVRDLWRMKGQVLAICLVIAAGVATFVMSLSTLDSLQGTLDAYYERYRFGDVFAHLKRAPNSLTDRLAEVPGVAEVQTRVVEDVTLDVAGMPEPAIGRLVSIPDRPRSGLNALYLRSGRYIEPGRDNEVLVSEAFALAHALKPGDSLLAIINGRKQRLRIVGVALSPEHIYQFAPGELLPDARRFGVIWMGYTELAAAFNMQGAFNDTAVTLTPDANESEVLRRIDQLTAPYGGLGAYGRADQPSHQFVTNEMKELRGMALVIPAIFLAVAAFLLNVVVSRLIQMQREQIAALKAFGYMRREIGLHYLKLVLLIVVCGVALGTLIGAWMGRGMTEIYTAFFRFPVFTYRLSGSIVLIAFAISSGAAVLGTLRAVAGAAALPPAEAMRPEPPATYRPLVLERLGLGSLFSPTVRMILRQLERRPLKALLTTLGIALAVSVLVVGSFGLDAIEHVIDTQFYLAQRQDVTIVLVEPGPSAVIDEVRHLPGVHRCEGFRTLPARLRSAHHARRVAIQGLEADGQLNRLMDMKQQVVAIPPNGLILSAKLAAILEVGVGDSVTVEVLEAERPDRDVPVVGLVDDFSGLAAYMDIQAANRLMREGTIISGAFLTVDQDHVGQLYTTLKNTPRTASVTVKAATLRSFRQTIAENLLLMRTITIVFAAVIAIGVVYNSARISLSERSRELATLRVIGFTRGEVSLILLGELAILTLIAIPTGLALGRALAALVIRVAYDTELFRIPLVVTWFTYGFAAMVTLLAAVFSGGIAHRLLAQLDLVAVLKSKE
ncbi:MAG TPA: FtsX-like permease family protein [Gemmataceae bacterium]|nr:FtsX-like permease family protein [Gemmataceae bacterium]